MKKEKEISFFMPNSSNWLILHGKPNKICNKQPIWFEIKELFTDLFYNDIFLMDINAIKNIRSDNKNKLNLNMEEQFYSFGYCNKTVN